MEEFRLGSKLKAQSEDSVEKINRDIIQKEIIKCVQDIDRKYYNPNFNLMGEIVNIFGDVNWEKVKLDIERLNKIDEKMDKVIKLIVEQHSEEFFRILGYVRQINNMIETSKLKLNEGRDVLSNINSIISNLSTGENSDWKLKSFYCTEIISKLNKTSQIFKIIQDCEVFVENSKIFDAICLLKKTHREHLEYDKEFRGFNCIVPINMRFEKIHDQISTKILKSLDHILFFTAPGVLEKKVASLLNYFLSSYTKISIDNELTKPLEKFMFVINALVNKGKTRIESESNDLDQDFKEKIVDLDAEKILSSLPYLIKCLKNYDNSFKIFSKLSENISANLESLLERTVKTITDQLKSVDFHKYDLDSKVEKIKFLVFFQILLLAQVHTLTKLLCLVNCLKNKTVNDFFENIFSTLSSYLIIPLQVYNKMSAPKSELDSDNTNTQINSIESKYVQIESVVRMKINEVLVNSIDYLPMLYKIYHKFNSSVLKLHNYKLKQIDETLNCFTSDLFSFYAKKAIPKKIFDINSFLSDYDGENANFKFITELISKINRMKEILKFSFDGGLVELTKIIKEIFNKYYEDTKSLIDKIKLECVYNPQFNSIHEEIVKTKDFKELVAKLEFKKYEKKLIDIQDSSEKYNKNFHKILVNFISTAGVKNPNEPVVLVTRNYKLMELLTKFVSCTEHLISIGDSFLNDLMKAEFSPAKKTAVLEQVNSMHFMDMKNSKDLSSMLITSFKVLDKLAGEISKLLLICRIEFAFLMSSLVKILCKNEYWLHEPQMLPEHFVTAFINDFNMYNSLFQYNLTGAQYEFVSKDYLLLCNDIFIRSLRNLQSNSVNNFGVSLLVRNFEHIKDKFEKIGDETLLKSVFYFPNLVRLLNVDENCLTEELKKYYEVKQFDDEYIRVMLNIRTNMRHTLSEAEKTNILKAIFN